MSNIQNECLGNILNIQSISLTFPICFVQQFLLQQVFLTSNPTRPVRHSLLARIRTSILIVAYPHNAYSTYIKPSKAQNFKSPYIPKRPKYPLPLSKVLNTFVTIVSFTFPLHDIPMYYLTNKVQEKYADPDHAVGVFSSENE